MVRFALHLTLTSCALLFGACGPSTETVTVAAAALAEPAEIPTPSEKHTPEVQPEGGSASALTSSSHPARLIRTSLGGIPVEAFTYDARQYEAVVLDQEQGPGSKWQTTRSAGESANGIAAVNAGFFTPEGAPLGLVVTSGNRRGSINRASSLGSGFYTLTSGNPSLVRREAFGGRGSEVLQAGPFLLERGKKVGGLSQKASTARTFIASDGHHGWVIARTGPCSLDQLASALSGAKLGSVQLRTALNLDGGRSSEIWVGKGASGGGIHTRPLWNKPVRNYLVVREK